MNIDPILPFNYYYYHTYIQLFQPFFSLASINASLFFSYFRSEINNLIEYAIDSIRRMMHNDLLFSRHKQHIIYSSVTDTDDGNISNVSLCLLFDVDDYCRLSYSGLLTYNYMQLVCIFRLNIYLIVISRFCFVCLLLSVL